MTSKLEQQIYTQSWEDGQLDLFAGAGILTLGVGWMLDQFVISMMIALPVLLSCWSPVRDKIISPRTGSFEYSLERQQSNRMSLNAVLMIGAGIFALLALKNSHAGDSREFSQWIAPGIIAFLVSIPLLLTGVLLKAYRFVQYSILMIFCGLLVVMMSWSPGVSLTIGGAVIASVAIGRLTKFLRTNPIITEEASSERTQ